MHKAPICPSLNVREYIYIVAIKFTQKFTEVSMCPVSGEKQKNGSILGKGVRFFPTNSFMHVGF